MANAAAMSAAGATNNRLQQAQQTPPRSLTQSPLFLNGSNQGGGFFRFPSSTFETNSENGKIFTVKNKILKSYINFSIK